MPAIEVNIEVYCAECGEGLCGQTEAAYTRRRGESSFRVTPCHHHLTGYPGVRHCRCCGAEEQLATCRALLREACDKVVGSDWHNRARAALAPPADAQRPESELDRLTRERDEARAALREAIKP